MNLLSKWFMILVTFNTFKWCRGNFLCAEHYSYLNSILTPFSGLYPQIRLLYGIKNKAAISLPYNLHCIATAALFFIPYSCPIWRHCPFRYVHREERVEKSWQDWNTLWPRLGYSFTHLTIRGQTWTLDWFKNDP